MSKILIGIPIRGINDTVKWKTDRCLDALRATTKHAVEIYYARGQQITQNSLDLVLKVLNESWDYLLYTGDDITFAPWALDQLVARDVDVVAGVCTYKTPPFWTTGMVESGGDLKRFLVTRSHVASKALIELDAVGSGFMLIKRSTLEAVHDYLHYKVYPNIPPEYRWMSPVPYFPVMYNPDRNMLTGSDYSFCRMAKKAGKRVFMDCGVVCGHSWEYEFDVEDHWNWLDNQGFTEEYKLYPGQRMEKVEPPVHKIYWGELGAPVPISITTRGSEYHTFNYIIPVLGARYEPLDKPELEAANDVGYIVGLFVNEDKDWDTYMAWAKRFKKVLIHWVGSDAMFINQWLTPERAKILRDPMFVHIAQDERLVGDIIEWMGNVHVVTIPTNKQFPIAPLPPDFTVFVYYPKHRHDFHYGDVMREVIEKMPDVTFRLCHLWGEKPDFEYPNMVWMGNLEGTDYATALARSSCVLRLSKHEGNPLTVAEAAIMGRRMVTNFDMPYTQRVPDEPTADQVVAALNAIRQYTEPDETISRAYRDIHNQRKFRDAVEELAGVEREPVVLTSEMAKWPYDYKNYFEFRYGQGERGAGGPKPMGAEAEWAVNRITSLIAEHDCQTVLDIGCGSMVRWPKLPVDAANYTGCDISPKALEFARQRFPDATFLNTDVTTEAIPKADAVISIDMMQHIRPSDFDAVLKRLAESANKILVIKTSVGIENGYYQFNHDFRWSKSLDGFDRLAEEQVPEVPVGRVFIFARKEQDAGPEPKSRKGHSRAKS